MEHLKQIIIIDDDALENKALKTLIEATDKSIAVEIFNSGEQGLEYIRSNYSKKIDNVRTDVLVIINTLLEDMSAWNFADTFHRMNVYVKRQVTIFVMADTVNKSDLKKSLEHPYINLHLYKPINPVLFDLILRSWQKDIAKKYA